MRCSPTPVKPTKRCVIGITCCSLTPYLLHVFCTHVNDEGCGHCKKLAPALSEAAEKIKEVDPNIVFAKVCKMIQTVG